MATFRGGDRPTVQKNTILGTELNGSVWEILENV